MTGVTGTLISVVPFAEVMFPLLGAYVAVGVDVTAAQGALMAGGSCIGVLGSPIDDESWGGEKMCIRDSHRPEAAL